MVLNVRARPLVVLKFCAFCTVTFSVSTCKKQTKKKQRKRRVFDSYHVCYLIKKWSKKKINVAQMCCFMVLRSYFLHIEETGEDCQGLNLSFRFWMINSNSEHFRSTVFNVWGAPPSGGRQRASGEAETGGGKKCGSLSESSERRKCDTDYLKCGFSSLGPDDPALPHRKLLDYVTYWIPIELVPSPSSCRCAAVPPFNRKSTNILNILVAIINHWGVWL